ncbi:hypothetical protein ACFL1H_08250 [Nanoarchaeota archaeon]
MIGWLMLALYIVGAVLAFIFIKQALKAAALVIIIGIILAVVGVFFIFQDVNDLQTKFPTEPKIFLLKEENQALVGFNVIDFANLQQDDLITADELATISQLLEQKDYKTILGDKYKLFLIDINLIKDKLTLQELDAVRDSSTPIEIRASIFLNALDEFQDFTLIIKEYKKGNIDIYPRTILFRAIKWIPNFVIDWIFPSSVSE